MSWCCYLNESNGRQLIGNQIVLYNRRYLTILLYVVRKSLILNWLPDFTRYVSR